MQYKDQECVSSQWLFTHILFYLQLCYACLGDESKAPISVEAEFHQELLFLSHTTIMMRELDNEGRSHNIWTGNLCAKLTNH